MVRAKDEDLPFRLLTFWQIIYISKLTVVMINSGMIQLTASVRIQDTLPVAELCDPSESICLIPKTKSLNDILVRKYPM